MRASHRGQGGRNKGAPEGLRRVTRNRYQVLRHSGIGGLSDSQTLSSGILTRGCYFDVAGRSRWPRRGHKVSSSGHRATTKQEEQGGVLSQPLTGLKVQGGLRTTPWTAPCSPCGSPWAAFTKGREYQSTWARARNCDAQSVVSFPPPCDLLADCSSWSSARDYGRGRIRTIVAQVRAILSSSDCSRADGAISAALPRDTCVTWLRRLNPLKPNLDDAPSAKAMAPVDQKHCGMRIGKNMHNRAVQREKERCLKSSCPIVVRVVMGTPACSRLSGPWRLVTPAPLPTNQRRALLRWYPVRGGLSEPPVS